MTRGIDAAPVRAGIVETEDEDRLGEIVMTHVQAVVCRPRTVPTWLGRLGVAVADGAWHVPRTILDNATTADIATWLGKHLPADAVPVEVRDAVRADVISLVHRVGNWTRATRFMFRILTGTPSRHCGFHVDTVAPGLPPWGLLRVYNGAGTDYVAPDDITSMREFYRYLSRRERLVGEMDRCHKADDAVGQDRHLQEIERLDGARPFLHADSPVFVAPAGSIVAFKHLDIGLHWSNHDRALAWVHCSPMAGEPRFLVNVTPRMMASRSGWRGRAATRA